MVYDVELTKTSRDTAVSERQHKALVKLIKRQGIHNIDPKSPEGLLLNKWFLELDKASDQSIPPIMRSMLIEKVIEAMLISRSAMTLLATVRAPGTKPIPSTEAKLKAYNSANASWGRAVGTVTKILALLGIGKEAQIDKGQKLKNFFDEVGVDLTKDS